MENEKIKRMNVSKYIAAFGITTLIFVCGIILGGYLSENKISEINNKQTKLLNNLFGLELSSQLLEENICDNSISSISKERGKICLDLSMLESSVGRDNPQLLIQKENYFLIEVKEFLMIQKIKSICDTNKSTILFFYSNSGDCNTCENQGYILDAIFEQNKESVNILSFDFNLDNIALKTLKMKYNITHVPTVLINEGTKLEGLHSKEEIESYLE